MAVFLEPPIVVEKADMPWNTNMDDFDSSATTESEVQTPETTPRAWWLTNADRTELRRESASPKSEPHGMASEGVHELMSTGMDESLAYLHKAMIEQGPFDGIMGFSQGACMAAVLAALVSPEIISRSTPLIPAGKAQPPPHVAVRAGDPQAEMCVSCGYPRPAAFRAPLCRRRIIQALQAADTQSSWP